MKYKPVCFPPDNLMHKAVIEWWYFNGHLQDEQGKGYSFMDCLFKVDPKKDEIPLLTPIFKTPLLKSVPYIYFKHSIVSDLSRRKNYKNIQYLFRINRQMQKPGLFSIQYGASPLPGAKISGKIIETKKNHYHFQSDNVDLQLVPRKSALLEGKNGFVQLCGHSYYYCTLTDLAAIGTMKIGKRSFKVSGKVWMDHQWANEKYDTFHRDKWSWFGLQLDNGTDLMCVEYDTGRRKGCQIDLMNKQGQQHHLQQMTLKPGHDFWRSKKTKSAFPMAWQIQIPQAKISLSVKSLMPDQEMIFNEMNYWESPVTATGTMAGKKIKALGFMELVGYKSNYNFLKLASQEINKTIVKEFKERNNKLFRKFGWEEPPSLKELTPSGKVKNRII